LDFKPLAVGNASLVTVELKTSMTLAESFET
jgi:hypothetical protein